MYITDDQYIHVSYTGRKDVVNYFSHVMSDHHLQNMQFHPLICVNNDFSFGVD